MKKTITICKMRKYYKVTDSYSPRGGKCMSSVTCTLSGTDMLLLAAWQVSTVPRSFLTIYIQQLSTLEYCKVL